MSSTSPERFGRSTAFGVGADSLIVRERGAIMFYPRAALAANITKYHAATLKGDEENASIYGSSLRRRSDPKGSSTCSRIGSGCSGEISSPVFDLLVR